MMGLVRGLALVVSLAATAQTKGPEDIELFVDRGDTYVRAGSNQGIKVGAALTIVGDRIGDTQERRVVGSASVLEVYPTIARVNLDKASQAVSGEKFARLAMAEEKPKP